MKPQIENIVRYAIAIAMLSQTIGFLITGKDPNLASFIGASGIILTPKIPNPKWFDTIVLAAAIATFGHLKGVI